MASDTPRVTARSRRTPTGVETVYRVNGRVVASAEAVEEVLTK